MTWKEKSLGDYITSKEIDIQTGPFGTQLKASDYSNTGIPVINVRNIGYGILKNDKIEHLPEAAAKKFSKHLLKKNDIVLGRKGAVDRHLLVTASQSGWIQGSDCIRIRITGKRLLPKYISYAFLLEEHKKWIITQCSNKATMASLNQNVISRIRINLPDLETQKKIIAVLSSYDDLIENNRRRIALLEQSARLLYQEWFVRFRFPGHEKVKIANGVPEGWIQAPASQAITINPTVPSQRGKAITYVPMSSISETGMVINKNHFEIRTKHTTVRFKNHDTLFARITPCLENGKTGFVSFLENGDIACGSTEFIILRGNMVSAWFTYLLSRQDDFRENAIKSMIGSSGRQRVQPSCFDRYNIAIPPQPIQDEFDLICSDIFSQIYTLDKQNQKLAAARDLLLPRLMSGEIAV